jgi:transposase-like protein
MVLNYQGEHTPQWAAIGSIAAKIDCSGETLRNWIRQSGRDKGLRGDPSTDSKGHGQ